MDYCQLEKVPKGEDYQEFIPNEDDEEAPPFRNELTYIAGALFLEIEAGQPKWVFESYHNALQGKDFREMGKEPAQFVGELYSRAVSEHDDQQRLLADADNALKRSIEEKKVKELEAAKKAKAGKGKKKGKADDDADEDPGSKRQGSKLEQPSEEQAVDPSGPDGFAKALKARIPRPFIFGPVEFEGLNLSEADAPFDFEAQHEKVTSVLERSLHMPSGVCVHGYKVRVKGRTLKRRTSLLKHARFLKNLEVLPKPPPEPVAVEGDGADMEGEASDA